MARPARNFSRTAIAVAATCILGATATLPAMAAEEGEPTASFVVGITASAVAEAQVGETASAMVSAVPEEPGNDTADSSGETGVAEAAGSADAAGTTETPNESESAADGDGSDNGDSDASGANNEAEAGVDGGDDAAGSEGSTSDDDADSDGSEGEEPGETEGPQESATPPVTNPEPELPVVPVEPRPENSGPVMVPEEPGKVESPGGSRSTDEQSGRPTLNASISPEDDPAEKPSATTEAGALSQTGANELLIVLGIGALLVIGGLVLVVLRLRKRGE